MTDHVTVIGGGLGGLSAAIGAREAGFEVTIHEARTELGGRARTTTGRHQANWGPHVVYADGPTWEFLDGRGLATPAGRPKLTGRIHFRHGGRCHRLPPLAMVRALVKLSRATAPIDLTFRDWASSLIPDHATVAAVCSAMGVATFDHDPGRLSASFVHGIVRRTTAVPPTARYIPGGWGTLIDRLADHASAIGVDIETDSKVDALPGGPTIVATTLPRAAELVGDPSITWTGTRTALLDLGLRSARRDPFIISDLDECGWVETFSMADPSLAPADERLVQAQLGLRPDETLESGIDRIESLLDLGYPGWRERETWRRRARIENESGALDLPGTSWRDRPAIDRGDDVYLVGDMVAAPGLLSEVTVNAATTAVEQLTRSRRRALAA